MSSTSKATLVAAHPLRRVLLVSAAVALPLGIASSVVLEHCLPGVGLIPQAVCALTSTLLAYCARRTQLGTNKRASNTIGFLALINDTAAFPSILAVLILTWKRFKEYRWYHYPENHIFLTAYATAPLILSLLVHLYLALLNFFYTLGLDKKIVRALKLGPVECPNCHEGLQPSWAGHFTFAREAQAVGTVSQGPRFSDEDPSVALLDPRAQSPEPTHVDKGKDLEAEIV